jgi:uncharacterized Zn finger protein
LMFELVNVASLPVGKDYRPSTFLYTKRGEREGVFAKALRILKENKAIVKKLTFDGDNWEVEAIVSSDSSNQEYTVRIYVPLDFECSCPHGQHRFNPCKHVFAVTLKLLEIAGADVGDPILKHYIYEGLNRLAYHKAKTQHRLA